MTLVGVDRLAAPPRDEDGRVDLDRLADRLGPATIVLESSPGTPHALRWSFLALPSPYTLVDDGVTSRLHTAGRTQALGTDPFAAVDEVCDRLGLHPDAAPMPDDEPPFTGGLVGAFSYDLGRRIERLPEEAAHDRRHPALHLSAVTTTIAVDHVTEDAWLIHRSLPGVSDVAPDEIRSRLGTADGQPDPPDEPPPRTVTSSLDRRSYEAAVEAVLEHIAAGDVFQVNLSQRLSTPWTLGTRALYRRLRGASPAPHAALLPAIGVASISPESFLLATGRHVRTRPMKGTRPRHTARDEDVAAAEELAASAKDRAENVMVVDMQRNDLGRVCVEGTVTVPALCEVEAHPTVWQLVSTVSGRLSNGVGWGGLLRATLPCGSVTGAPKVAAMRLIEHHEPVRRGWYCGAVGWLGPGTLRLSVAIRTAVVTEGTAEYGCGGGIVADSDPDAEYEEAVTKAGAFLEAVNGTLDGAAA
ncbi:MAG: anthranilate synthase component I family protein [Nitriliruptorales bacterium]|nr:anthranilate synthase component I family protein [Nitriliruptorales bacterium]